MTKPDSKGLLPNFRLFFIRGLATLLPTILTIVLIFKCYEFIQDNISFYINESAIRISVLVLNSYPEIDYPKITAGDEKGFREHIKADPEIDLTGKQLKSLKQWKLRQQWHHGYSSLIGFGLAILLVYFVGRILASFIGRKLWGLFELCIHKIPLIKQVYPHIKQITDFLFGENKVSFSRVVAIEYPRKGLWSIGMVTGAGMKKLSEIVQDELITVFIPSSPTPVTGYVITVKNSEVVDLPITIDDALRFAVSAGVIVPQDQALPGKQIELLATKKEK